MRLAMKPGNNELDGFLGSDQRPLAEIIRADDETVKKLGLTQQIIATRMRDFREAGKNGLGEFVAVTPHFEVSCEIVRGLLPCPFGEQGRSACNATQPAVATRQRCGRVRSIAGRHRKTIVTVRNLRLRKEITFSDLNIHLIAAHGFYEGKGSPFRLEPAELAQILEIGGQVNGKRCCHG